MAKFKVGDMITGKLLMSDGTEETMCFLVNRVISENLYSVDDGNGFIECRVTASEVEHFTVC